MGSRHADLLPAIDLRPVVALIRYRGDAHQRGAHGALISGPIRVTGAADVGAERTPRGGRVRTRRLFDLRDRRVGLLPHARYWQGGIPGPRPATAASSSKIAGTWLRATRAEAAETVDQLRGRKLPSCEDRRA